MSKNESQIKIKDGEGWIFHKGCDIQDCIEYTVHYPKDMDKMNYEELVEIFNETMEAFAKFVRYEVFKGYEGTRPEIEIKNV